MNSKSVRDFRGRLSFHVTNMWLTKVKDRTSQTQDQDSQEKLKVLPRR